MTRPVVSRPKFPREVIAKAVERYMKGEQAVSLAKEYRVSVPGLYSWVKKAKEEAAKAARAQALGPGSTARETEINKELRLKHLEQENELLKKRLLDLMIKFNAFDL